MSYKLLVICAAVSGLFAGLGIAPEPFYLLIGK